MKKSFVLSIGLLCLLFNNGFAQNFDSNFRLANYNRNLADSYLEQAIQVNVKWFDAYQNQPYLMYNTYERNRGDEETLINAILSAVGRKYGGIRLEFDKDGHTMDAGLASAAARNNKDIVMRIQDMVVAINVVFHIFNKETGQWYVCNFFGMKM